MILSRLTDPPKDGVGVANKTNRILDFGYCLVRMNVGAQ
jgi:hypothetical protein